MLKKILVGTAVVTVIGLVAYSWFSNAEEAAAPLSTEPSPAKIIVLEQGQNFRPVVPALPTQTGDKIEVLEIFWYGCPHCYEFEPKLNQWLQNKPADVEVRRLPGVFRKSWVAGAKAFYTGEALGVLDKMHPALFNAIHAEQQPFADDDAWAKFFSGLGVSEEAFKNTWDSVEVAAKVRDAMAQGQAYGIEGVPAIVVAGKYQTSSGMEGIGDYDTLLKVVNALVDKVREEAKRQP